MTNAVLACVLAWLVPAGAAADAGPAATPASASGMPAPEVPAAEVTAAEVTAAEVTAAEVTAAEVPAPEAPAGEPDTSQAAQATALEALLSGPNSEPLDAERCIRSSSIETTDVLNSQLVVFKVGRRDIYINQLPVGCPGLRPRAKIALTSRDERLCQLDSIRVLYPSGMGANGTETIVPGPSCMLGKFERITPEQLQVLEERFTPRGRNVLESLFE